jgi:hypothetical protein
MVDFHLLGSFQLTLGYCFKDINYLIEAITHASVIHATVCYQQLGKIAG